MRGDQSEEDLCDRPQRLHPELELLLQYPEVADVRRRLESEADRAKTESVMEASAFRKLETFLDGGQAPEWDSDEIEWKATRAVYGEAFNPFLARLLQDLEILRRFEASDDHDEKWELWLFTTSTPSSKFEGIDGESLKKIQQKSIERRMKLLRKRREEFERLVAIALAIPEPRFFTQVGRIMDRLKSQQPEEMPTIRAWRIYHRVRFLCEGPPSFSEWQETCGLVESEAKVIAERLTLEFEVGREC